MSAGDDMPHEPYPTLTDLHELAGVHARLATHGIVAGAQGYDLDLLAGATYQQGWAYQIDRVAGLRGYQAAVQTPFRAPRTHRIGGMGWNPAVALAFALCAALEADTG